MNRVRLLLRCLLGGLLAAAGLLKAGGAWSFAETLANYRLLPALANHWLAVALPWWELAAGLLIALGLWLRPACWLACALFAAFASATLSALARGLDIECGCFGTGGGLRLGGLHLIFNAAGLAASLYLLDVFSGKSGRLQDAPAAGDVVAGKS